MIVKSIDSWRRYLRPLIYICTVAILSSWWQSASTLKAQDSAQEESSAPSAPKIIVPDSSYSYIVINSIQLEGNRLTKDKVIFRELDFAIGDTIAVADWQLVQKENRDQVYNLRLFNDVSIKIAQQQGLAVDLILTVEERWYIIASPSFKLTNRNLNDWVRDPNRDLSRATFGLLLVHENTRGMRERLLFNLGLGYIDRLELRNLELSYKIPFIGKKQRTGIRPFFSYGFNRQVAHKTLNNRWEDFTLDLPESSLLYIDSASVQRQLRIGLNVNHRSSIHVEHNFNISYYNNRIKDTLALSTPDYFLNGATQQKYLYLAYQLRLDHRDIRAYPLEGSLFSFQASKSGLGILSDEVNLLWFVASYSHFWKLNERWYAAGNLKGRVSFPAVQPYFTQNGLGGSTDYVRGYELYIIDGQHYGLLRGMIKYKLLDIKIKNPIKKLRQFRTLPFALYLKQHTEFGYVHDAYYFQGNPLNNSFLFGTGLSLDIVAAYDNLWGLEVSMNGRGEFGFFVAFKVNFE